MQGIEMMSERRGVSCHTRFIIIAGLLVAFCFTVAELRSDDTAKGPQDRASSLEDILGEIVEEKTTALLRSLCVEKDIELSLWKTVLSPQSLTSDELSHFNGNMESLCGVLLVQMILPKESELDEKLRLVPLVEGQIQISYDVLKRNVNGPIASMYYISDRQAREPHLAIRAFFVFDIERRTWARVPSTPSS